MSDASDDDIDPTTDLAVRTIYGEGADQSPEAQQAMIATAVNRARTSGTPIADQLTAPGQYQAWQNPKLSARMVSLSRDDPAYQAILANIAPVLGGHVSTTATNYLNRDTTPPGSSALSTWGAKPGTKIDAQEFYGPNGVPAPVPAANGASDSAIDAMIGASPGALAPALTGTLADDDIDAMMAGKGSATPAEHIDAAAAADTLVKANAASDAPHWPVYDPTNHVGRNADGSIAYVGGPDFAPTVDPKTGRLDVTINRSGTPEAISSWLAAHPYDPANHLEKPEAPSPSGVAQGVTGVEQGLQSVGRTIEGADAAIKSNPVGEFFMRGIEGPGSLTGAQERADLGAGVIDRNRNDVNYGSSAPYQLGKFGGEVAATLPLMAATDGLGALGSAGLAGSRFAPAAEFLAGETPGALMGARGASLAARGALQGGEAAALTSGGSSNPLAQQVGDGALAGAVLGPAIPLGGKMIGGALNNAVAPKISHDAAALADTAINKFGIPVRLGQIMGVDDPEMALKDSQSLMKPGTGAAANQIEQVARWTKAALSTAGTQEPDVAAAIHAAGGDPERASPETMGAIRRALGARYNAVAQRTNIGLDSQLDADLTRIDQQSQEVGLDTGQANSVAKQIQKIRDAAAQNGGKISGAAYAGITDEGSSLSILQKAYGPLGDLADQVSTALNAGLARSAAPGDEQLLRNTDKLYKNLMTLAPITDVGKTDVGGLIRPSLLAARVRSNFSNSAFAGAGALGDLANVATLMKPPADSKSAARFWDYAKGALAAGGLGSEGLALWLHNPGAAMAIAGTAGAGAAAKYGGNVVQGARFGAKAGAAAVQRAVAPTSKFASPTLRRLGGIANDNYVPVGVLGANRMMQQQAAP